MTASTQDLIDRIELLKQFLVTAATGGGPILESFDYKQARLELLRDPKVKSRIPEFVKKCRDQGEFWQFIKFKYGTYHERRAYLQAEFDPVLSFLEDDRGTPVAKLAEITISMVDAEHIRDAWLQAIERVAVSPDAAITSARTLLESTCKFILEKNQITYDEGADLPTLYSLTAKSLNLSPSQHTEKIFKQILGGCHSVVEGLGALRSKHGDAHGRSIKAVKPAPRHAELAVNLAGSMALFLIQTWEAKQPK